MSAVSTQPLRDLCTFRHGGTPSKSNASFWKGDIPWVSPKDMKQAVIDSTTDYISAEGLANSATSIVPPGSILLVVRSGILAHSFPIAQVAKPVAFNQDIKAVTPISGDVVPDYLYWFLRSQSPNVVTRGVKKGATVHSVQSGFIENLLVPMHPREKQRRIVDLLARAEGIVRLRREAQRKAAELIPAIFIDMFGDPATNSKGWPIRQLGDLLEMPLRNGISPARSGRHSARVLTLSAITRGQFDQTAVKTALFTDPVAESDEVCASDFLICRGNGNKSLVGAGCFPNRDMRGVAFPDTAIAVRPNRSLLAPRFLAGLWSTALVRRQIDAIAKTTNGTFKINQTGIAGIRLVVPPMSDQLRFNSSVQAIDSLSMHQADALTKATAAFAALLSRAFH